MTEISLQNISDYITDTRGRWFTSDEVNRHFNADAGGKAHICTTLNRLADKGKLERHRDKSAKWREIDSTAPEMMNFKAASQTRPVECYLPFHLEDFFNIYPSNVFVYSGVSNYGKTELLMQTAYLNPQAGSVYLNTDAEEEEMLVRVNAYQPWEAWRTKFTRKVKSHEIPELIARHYKDQFVFVDYLKVMKDYFEVASLIEDCGSAVGKGLCFIGLQKNKGVEWGRGGQQTLDLARFYCNLDPGPADVERPSGFSYKTTELKIVKCKMLKDSRYDPNDWKFIYRMIYRNGEQPTYKMIFEPPAYTQFNKQRAVAPETIEVTPQQEDLPW